MARIHIRTLGQTDLTAAEGGSILSVLSQPKRFALLDVHPDGSYFVFLREQEPEVPIEVTLNWRASRD